MRQIVVTPYFPQLFSCEFPIFECSVKTDVVETYLSFFGAKSVTKRWKILKPKTEFDFHNQVSQIQNFKSALKEMGH